MITKLEIWGSPDIQITEAGDPIQFKTESDLVRVRIREGRVNIEVRGQDDDGSHWKLYIVENGDLELSGIFPIRGGK